MIDKLIKSVEENEIYFCRIFKGNKIQHISTRLFYAMIKNNDIENMNISPKNGIFVEFRNITLDTFEKLFVYGDECFVDKYFVSKNFNDEIHYSEYGFYNTLNTEINEENLTLLGIYTDERWNRHLYMGKYMGKYMFMKYYGDSIFNFYKLDRGNDYNLKNIKLYKNIPQIKVKVQNYQMSEKDFIKMNAICDLGDLKIKQFKLNLER